MAYTRENLLKKIVAVQEIVLEAKKKGISQKHVYDNQIKDSFFISLATFNNYLAMNAKKELEQIEKRKKEKLRQQTIAFDYE